MPQPANPNYQNIAQPMIQQPIPYVQPMVRQVNPMIPNNVYPPMYVPKPIIVDNRRNNCIKFIIAITFIVIFIILAVMMFVIFNRH